MSNYSPVKIENLSSNLCAIYLKNNQSLQIKIPKNTYKINIDSMFLDHNESSGIFEVFQKNNALSNWNYSNFYLGNIEILSRHRHYTLCVFLDLSSNLCTIVNPKSGKIKINSNQILEVVLCSENKNKFLFNEENSKNLDYNTHDNNIISSIFGNKIQHHIWLKFPSQTNNIKFKNDFGEVYGFLLEVKSSKNKNCFYSKKIKLIKK